VKKLREFVAAQFVKLGYDKKSPEEILRAGKVGHTA
jgi:hypothetical protein